MPSALRLRVLVGGTLAGISAWKIKQSLCEPRDGLHKTITSVTDNTRTEAWETDERQSGIGGLPWSIRKRTLHGGRQEGSEEIEVENGVLRFTVLPTRGMSIGKLEAGRDLPLGWASPVREVVHPKHVDLQDSAGLGWLTGFNEWLVRCGVAFAGHPGTDGAHLLTLHGRIGNTPASEVTVSVDAAPPNTIRVRGRVDEAMFKFADWELWTEVSTEPGGDKLRVNDMLVNRSSYAREYQIIYHTNFGPPMLGAGAQFEAPVASVSPFNQQAANELAAWQTYRLPTAHYGETVYCVTPHSDASGHTLVALVSAASDRGVTCRYATGSLPSLSLWKNTDTLEEGYVTGIEPGSGFPYRRELERKAGRVPTLPPGGSITFSLEWQVLRDAAAVALAREEIRGIQRGRVPTVAVAPLATP